MWMIDINLAHASPPSFPPGLRAVIVCIRTQLLQRGESHVAAGIDLIANPERDVLVERPAVELRGMEPTTRRLQRGRGEEWHARTSERSSYGLVLKRGVDRFAPQVDPDFLEGLLTSIITKMT
jgi:hypothetical protein